jgi:hypothetical protein
VIGFLEICWNSKKITSGTAVAETLQKLLFFFKLANWPIGEEIVRNLSKLSEVAMFKNLLTKKLRAATEAALRKDTSNHKDFQLSTALNFFKK